MKRIPLIAAVLVLASGTAIGSWWFFRDHRPSLASGQRYGIDVSHHQGEIDWSAVAGDDIEFAYIKATEGGDWVDSRFEKNWAEAKAAGIDISAYHFFTLCRSGSEQAANFLSAVSIAEADMPLALDLEFAAACSTPMSPAVLRANVVEFVEIVEEATGERLLLYLMDDFDDEFAVSSVISRPRWVRSLYHRPGTDWVVWQYSATSRVDGIDGDVDLNVGS